MRPSSSRNSVVIAALSAVLSSGIVLAAEDDQLLRENLVLLPDGRHLVVIGADGNAGIALRNAHGSDDVIAVHGQCVEDCDDTPGMLLGIGSNPHANSDGEAVFKGIYVFDDDDLDGSDEIDHESALFLFEGDALTPLVYSRTDGLGSAIGDDTVCEIEPRPWINDSGQVGFVVNLDPEGPDGDGPDPAINCGHWQNNFDQRSAALRFTPGTGIEVMMLADSTTTLETVGGFRVEEVSFLENGAQRMNDSGEMVVEVYLQGQGDSLVRLNGPGDHDVIAIDGMPYSEVNGGVINESGAVLFRTESPEALHVWTADGGIETIVESGDTLPGSSLTFDGFTPHPDFNNSGNAAFVAGIDFDDTDDDNEPQGIFYFDSSSNSITDIAHSELAPGNISSINGLTFDEIASVAMINERDEVFFVAEQNDFVDQIFCEDNSEHDDWTAIFRWTEDDGIDELVREGQILPDGSRILRIYVNSPEMRAQINDNGRLAVMVDVGAGGGCDKTGERTLVLPDDVEENSFDLATAFLALLSDDAPPDNDDGGFLGAFGVHALLVLLGLFGTGLAWRARRS